MNGDHLARAGTTSTAPLVAAARLDRDDIGEAWLRAKRLRSGSDNTVTAYRRDLASWFAWCDDRGLDVFSVFAPDVETYVEHLRAGRSQATVARMVTAVSSFYIYAGRHTGGIVTNPVTLIERPVVDTSSRTLGLSRAEVDVLREKAREKGPREYAMVQLLLGTGLRVSELCRADTRDVTTDIGRDVLLVTRKGGKRGRVPLPPGVLRALRMYVGDRHGPLFLLDNGRRMTRRMVDYHVTTLAAAAGIKKRISPHSLRHTAATLALDAGASLRDVQVQLGHARPDTTARYDRARRELDNRAAAALAAIVDSSPMPPPPGEHL